MGSPALPGPAPLSAPGQWSARPVGCQRRPSQTAGPCLLPQPAAAPRHPSCLSGDCAPFRAARPPKASEPPPPPAAPLPLPSCGAGAAVGWGPGVPVTGHSVHVCFPGGQGPMGAGPACLLRSLSQGSDLGCLLCSGQGELAGGRQAFLLCGEGTERLPTPVGVNGLPLLVSGSSWPPGSNRLSGSSRSQGEIWLPGGQDWACAAQQPWTSNEPGTEGLGRRGSDCLRPDGADPQQGTSLCVVGGSRSIGWDTALVVTWGLLPPKPQTQTCSLPRTPQPR